MKNIGLDIYNIINKKYLSINNIFTYRIIKSLFNKNLRINYMRDLYFVLPNIILEPIYQITLKTHNRRLDNSLVWYLILNDV